MLWIGQPRPTSCSTTTSGSDVRISEAIRSGSQLAVDVDGAADVVTHEAQLPWPPRCRSPVRPTSPRARTARRRQRSDGHDDRSDVHRNRRRVRHRPRSAGRATTPTANPEHQPREGQGLVDVELPEQHDRQEEHASAGRCRRRCGRDSSRRVGVAARRPVRTAPTARPGAPRRAAAPSARSPSGGSSRSPRPPGRGRRSATGPTAPRVRRRPREHGHQQPDEHDRRRRSAA